MNSGIYLIVNTINNKIYVGSSIKLQRRWGRHKIELRANNHHNSYLQLSWNKYGENVFKFYVLECIPIRDLLIREQYWLDKLKPFGKIGYNISPIAGNTLGVKPSQETLNKMSLANIGKKLTKETKDKISIAFKGRKKSEEHRKKMIFALIGRKVSEETKAKLSEAQRKRHAARR